jgi:hypothetical protein
MKMDSNLKVIENYKEKYEKLKENLVFSIK